MEHAQASLPPCVPIREICKLYTTSGVDRRSQLHRQHCTGSTKFSMGFALLQRMQQTRSKTIGARLGTLRRPAISLTLQRYVPSCSAPFGWRPYFSKLLEPAEWRECRHRRHITASIAAASARTAPHLLVLWGHIASHALHSSLSEPMGHSKQLAACRRSTGLSDDHVQCVPPAAD